LRELGVRPSKRLGQNFLVDPRIAARIAALVEDPREPVVEIGPGLGSLTALLAKSGRPLVAVELDLRLAEAVERRLAPYPAARVVRGDILDQRLDGLLEEIPADSDRDAPAPTVTIVGNLPYSITTPAMEWILAQGPRVRRALLMVQREYARRLAARPGTKDFGSISIFVGLHAEVSVLFTVSSGAFYPRPNVDSVVMELTPRPYPGTTAAERSAVERLARAGMGTRRKTLPNSLARGLGMNVEEARGLLASAGIRPERRAETLSIDEWVGLARRWPAGAAPLEGVR
jgi:16S rRNA (adenine1518-N6/adenine1519-N6)-dimethyltransferase